MIESHVNCSEIPKFCNTRNDKKNPEKFRDFYFLKSISVRNSLHSLLFLFGNSAFFVVLCKQYLPNLIALDRHLEV